MRNILKAIGWLGMLILALLDIGNPTHYEHRPNDDTAVIIGCGLLVILLIGGFAVGYYLYVG